MGLSGMRTHFSSSPDLFQPPKYPRLHPSPTESPGASWVPHRRFEAWRSDSLATEGGDSRLAGSVGVGIQALSSLNRLRNSRSASTGSNGSVISNGARVCRIASSGIEPSSEWASIHSMEEHTSELQSLRHLVC